MTPLIKFQRGCVALAVSQAISLPVQAANIEVDNATDIRATSSCTLRAAILSANSDTAFDNCEAGSGDDSITFFVAYN